LKKDFYIYKCLQEIHRLNQNHLLKNGKGGIILILNTPGSLEHFMVHTDPDKLQLIFSTLLDHVSRTLTRGSIEFGYKLGREDSISCYVKEPPLPVYSQARFENRFETEAVLKSEISKNLEGLGGNFWIEKEQDTPKMFWFAVEIQPPGTGLNKNTSDAETAETPDWSEKTILIVDDVHTNLILLESVLDQTKARVISVDNGLKAVNAVKREKDIDFVLMDVRMPVLDGYEATRRIKRIKPWLPVVAISAYGSSSESKNWKMAGCDAFIGKPLNSFELTKTMQSLFDNVPIELK
jgi:CheY-like chemotaxis protein